MLSEAYQRVATLQICSNCCSFIVIFAALSSAMLKCERAFREFQTLLVFFIFVNRFENIFAFLK